MSGPGQLRDHVPINEEVSAITLALRGDIEAQAGGAFETFVPVSYSSQVVAGTNFFVKINVGSSHIHARIFRPLPHTGAAPSLHSIQTGKDANSPMDYF